MNGRAHDPRDSSATSGGGGRSLLKPSISRRLLLVIAGGLWSAVGAVLILRAVGWLLEMGAGRGILYGSVGVLLAVPAYRFGMVRIARKNLRRISALPDRPCLFAFTAWKGYLVIGTMVTGGILLRNSPLPKELLALLYSGMGGALILGSTQFFRTFLDSRREVT